MRALLGSFRRTNCRARQRDRLKSLAVPCLQRTPIPQSSPLEIGNIVGRAIIRLIGAVLLEANDEWQMQHRYMGVEAMGEMLNPSPTNETLQLPPRPA